MAANNPPQDRPVAEPDRTESKLRHLVRTGLMLASERSLDVIVQGALDAGLELSGAAFGAFFYNLVGEDGESYVLYKLAGTAAEAFAGFPLPRPTQIFAYTFEGKGILRSDDITLDPRYGRNRPLAGLPPRHIPVRSYLAVPVQSASGEVLGGMFYGHPEVSQIPPAAEDLVATVAAQAAVAILNARLSESITKQIALADSARLRQRETAERLAQVLESTTDGVILLDRNWVVTFANSHAERLVAAGRDIVGNAFWDLFPDAVGTAFEQRYNEAMQQHRAVEFTEFYAPLGLWTFVRAFPTPEGIAIFFQDVSRQKTDEAAAAQTAARLRQALDAGQFGTWTWDRATDMLDFDERGAALFGVEPHVPVSRTLLREARVLSEDRPATPKDFSERLADGGTYLAEYRIQGTDGVRWISASGLPVRPPGATESTGMSGTVQDITARKTQEATLRQSEKLAATGRLAATIAHEINNPLEAITNLIFLCKTDPTVPREVQRLLGTADTELARVAQIAQQALGFYRDTARPTEIDVTALLASVVDLFSRKLLSKKVTCTLDLAQDLRIFGLQGEIKQVFSNLLVNAIDASSANTTIRIRSKSAVRSGQAGVSVLMVDQGPGIPAELRSRLFSPFFTTKQTTGTGLGLWVTRGIVEKQGGRISFRSCTEGQSTGTVFRVFLPKELRETEAFRAPQSPILQ